MLSYIIAESCSTVHQRATLTYTAMMFTKEILFFYTHTWSLSYVTMLQRGRQYAPHGHLAEHVHNKKLNATIPACVCLFIVHA